MASNFKISISKTQNGLSLKLFGDFDGTSAYELINVLKDSHADNSNIFIHVDGLKNVFPFGRDLLQKYLSANDSQTSMFVFTGNETLALSSKYDRPQSPR